MYIEYSGDIGTGTCIDIGDSNTFAFTIWCQKIGLAVCSM